MLKAILVAADIPDGLRVIEEVEKIMQVTAAFWIYLEEEDESKLVIVSPDVASKGPFNLYKNLAVLLNNLSIDQQKPVQMPLTRVTLVSPNSLLYQRVKQFGRALDTHIYKLQ